MNKEKTYALDDTKTECASVDKSTPSVSPEEPGNELQERNDEARKSGQLEVMFGPFGGFAGCWT